MRLGGAGTVVLAGVLSIVAHAAIAVAEEDPESLIRQGNQLRQRGNSERAHGYFKRAYDIAHTGRTAAQLGLVEMAIHHFLDAEIHLTEALTTNDAWVEENRKLLDETRERGRAHLGRVEIHGAPAGTAVQIDGRPPVPVPLDGLLWAPPGSPTLSFALPSGPPLAKQVIVSAGATASIELGMAPAAMSAGDRKAARAQAAAPSQRSAVLEAPSPPHQLPTPSITPAATDVRLHANGTEPSSGDRTGRIVAIASAGLGIASGVTGLLLYRSGLAKLDAIKADATAMRPFDQSNSYYLTLQQGGVTLMIAGGTAVAAGVVLYLLNRNHHGSTEATVSIGCFPAGGGGMQIAGRLP